MSDKNPTSPGTSSGSAASTPAAQKRIEKLVKPEIKENLKAEIKDFKEKHEKVEKNEIKEHKDTKVEKHEKNEFKEHKDVKIEKHEKNEIKEHKDGKHEKIELKDIKEFSKHEIAEKVTFEGPQDPGGPIEQLPGGQQQGVAAQPHFIGADQRPDLSQGALRDEPDLGNKGTPGGQPAGG